MTLQLQCYGGPLDGELRTVEQLWLGFPGPWSVCLVGDMGHYGVNDQKSPTRLEWHQHVVKKGKVK